MPIEDTSGNANNAAIERMSPVSAAAQQPVIVQPLKSDVGQNLGDQGKWNFRNLRAMGGISRSASSEELQKGLAATKKFLEEKPLSDQYEFKVIPIDNTRETALSLSAIVIAVYPINDAAKVSYHTLLLEGSGDPLEAKSWTWNNRTVTIDVFAAEVYNQFYADRVRAIVSQSFPKSEVRPVSFTTVPRGYNWGTKENDDALRDLLVNTAVAVIGDLEQLDPNFEDADLSKHAKDERINTRVNLTDEPLINAVGKPVRADVQIVMSSVTTAKEGEGPNQQEKTTKIAEVAGYVDVLYAPLPMQQNNGWQGQGNGQRPPLYAPHFVITRLENFLRSTTQSSLLGVVGATALAENQNWQGYFSRHSSRQDYSTRALGATSKRSGSDPRDFGALNIEQNVEMNPNGFGAIAKTKDLSVQSGDLSKMLKQFLRPQLVFSLDVSEGGPDTWLNEVYVAAANGDVSAQRAILEAANRLTGTKFNDFWNNSGESPVIVIDNRVFLGDYTIDDVTRDIRDLDYIAIANLAGVNNPQSIQAYSDTITAINIPLEKRMEEQKKIILQSIQGTVRITGRARRVTFTGKFIDALIQGTRESGYRHQLVGELFGVDYNNARAEASFVESAMFNPSGMGLTSGGFSNNQQSASNFGSALHSRNWGR